VLNSFLPCALGWFATWLKTGSIDSCAPFGDRCGFAGSQLAGRLLDAAGSNQRCSVRPLIRTLLWQAAPEPKAVSINYGGASH
jgi:hypothetical protein